MRDRRHKSSGFTITELIAVMLILSIVATIATPSFTNSLQRFRADSSARRIMTDLNMARRRATILGKSVDVIFNTGTHSYSIPQVTSINGGTQPTQVSLSASPY